MFIIIFKNPGDAYQPPPKAKKIKLRRSKKKRSAKYQQSQGYPEESQGYSPQQAEVQYGSQDLDPQYQQQYNEQYVDQQYSPPQRVVAHEVVQQSVYEPDSSASPRNTSYSPVTSILTTPSTINNNDKLRKLGKITSRPVDPNRARQQSPKTYQTTQQTTTRYGSVSPNPSSSFGSYSPTFSSRPGSASPSPAVTPNNRSNGVEKTTNHYHTSSNQTYSTRGIDPKNFEIVTKQNDNDMFEYKMVYHSVATESIKEPGKDTSITKMQTYEQKEAKASPANPILVTTSHDKERIAQQYVTNSSTSLKDLRKDWILGKTSPSPRVDLDLSRNAQGLGRPLESPV